MATKIVVPELGESVVEATVGKWLKGEGDRVEVGEVLVELQTDKVDLEVGAEQAGVLAQIARQEGEDVKIGDVLGMIEPGETTADGRRPTAKAAAKSQAKTEVAPVATAAPKTDGAAGSREGERATPVAKRIAEEKQVDLAEVSGTGPGGRVTKQDVEGYLERQKPADTTADGRPLTAERESPIATAQPPAPSPQPQAASREERVRMSRRRRTIARRLVEAQHTAAMLTTFNEVDMSAVMAMRGRRQEAFLERHGVKLGFMSFFVKASVGALKAFPRLNAEIDGEEMILKHYYDIGIAVGSEEGLVVPVLREADRLTFAEIELRIKEFAQKVQDGSLSLEDLRGGTFTITNGGVFGSLLSTPILNAPQVGILGLHKIEERPVAVKGEVAIRPMMYVALSYDHRLVDGREAVQFLVRVKELIEDPETLLLEG